MLQTRSGKSTVPSASQLMWVRQAAERRYRSRAKPGAARVDEPGLDLDRLEQNREYQRLLARLVRLSKRFQGSLTAEQRSQWLALEDALLDYAWFLHGYYFKAGYQLGKTAMRPRRPPDQPIDRAREQAMLLSAFAKLLDKLTM